jgi:hypothetical protein
MAKTKSGSFWVDWANSNAQDSKSLDDLADPFKTNVKNFIQALQDAGATVDVENTLRSDKRAYLFHWSWLIGLGKADPSEPAPRPDIEIEWDHGDPAQTMAGAKEMIEGFCLAVPPACTNAPSLHSNHISGNAVDMKISWTGTINVKTKDGSEESIDFMADVDKNTKLQSIGASYGVKKLATDSPHWSVDGH